MSTHNHPILSKCTCSECKPTPENYMTNIDGVVYTIMQLEAMDLLEVYDGGLCLSGDALEAHIREMVERLLL